MTYKPRKLSKIVNEALKDIPVVVITGMRQTGKSTFLQNQPEFRDWKYITLDDFAQLAAAKENPDSFIDAGVPLIIDEAQKCPELLTAIKRRVDGDRTPGQFILSGSANILLMKSISESLAGRAAYFTMHPFTFHEIHGLTENTPFIKKFFEKPGVNKLQDSSPLTESDIMKGGMPVVSIGDINNPAIWFKGYEQTYLERDIRDLSRIGNVIPFRNLLHLIAFRNGGILNISDLARDAHLTSATVSSYLSVMEISYVFFRLAPFLKNMTSRLVKSPKIYISDSGLASYLCGLNDISNSLYRGAFFEGYTAQNLKAIIDASWPEANISFWNIQGRHEVDFIIEAGDSCMAIEVKSSGKWENADLAGLKAFLSSTSSCLAGVLAYNGSTPVRLGEKLWAIPLSVLLR